MTLPGTTDVMTRLGFAAILVLLLAGCSSPAAQGKPVHLLTGVVPGYTDTGGCFTDFALGKLIVDEQYGTAISDEGAGSGQPVITPVMWRPGFSGRRAGSEIEVLNPLGIVVATTNQRYQIAGGYWFESPRVFVACDYVLAK
jgi:hypothetical protein